MGARNRVGIGLSYRPARLHILAELIQWNRFLGSLKFKNSGSGKGKAEAGRRCKSTEPSKTDGHKNSHNSNRIDKRACYFLS